MKTLTLEAPAKINLTLDILGRRPDGYHDMRMVMQSVSLGDTVTVTETTEGFSLLAEDISLPAGRPTLEQRAAESFFRYLGRPVPGLEVRLVKRVPAYAGLGGGSADGDQTGPHPGCTVCAVSGSRLCVFLWNGDYHTGISEEDAGKDVQSYAGFADQVF